MAITPYLYYEDLGAALKWLARAFDFKQHGRAMGRTEESIMPS